MPDPTSAARPATRVRLIEQQGVVVAYPDTQPTPVLPSGWAPLTREQQEAVEQACAAVPDHVIFTLGSLSEPGCAYHVYRLPKDGWAGLSVVCKSTPSGRLRLLGLAWEPAAGLRIATDFFNWDSESVDSRQSSVDSRSR